jgi:peptide/nickel transport system substrate-binding protein
MTITRRKFVTTVGAAPFVGSVGATLGTSGAFAQEQPRRGGTLVYALGSDPAHFNLAITTDLNSQQGATHMFSQVLRVTKDGKFTGDLAESWHMAEDGLTYTFKIRQNAKWHDGRRLTAEDVRYALADINMKYNPIASTGFAAVDKIEAPDDTTLVIRMKTPFPAFLPWSFVNQWIYPKHIYEGTDPRQNERNYKNPIGSGPFMLREYVRGSHIVMERNPNYYMSGMPYLDRVVAKFIPNNAARVLALETGEVDYVSIYNLPASAVPDLRKHKDLTVFTHRNRVNYGGIMAHMNLRNEYLQRKEVRQALYSAIDRKLLVERAVAGLAEPASSPVSSLHEPWFNPAVANKYPFDPKKAEALLEQAGVKRGAGGRRFSIRISYAGNGEGGALQSAAEIMREQLRDVGIELVLEPKDYAVWMEGAHLKWDFDLSMGSYQTGPDPAIAVSRLYITRNIQKMMGRNLMGYSNAKVDQLFDAAEGELDTQKRIKLYHEVQDFLTEDMPVLWLWDRLSTMAHRNRVKGDIVGGTHLENFENVWVTDGK